MRDTFLVFGAPNIAQEEIKGLTSIMESGWLGTGPKVAQFEKEFATYKSATNAAAVNSCTAALHLSLLAAGVGPGDEVVTTPMTFCATINVIVHLGAVPVLADVDPITFNIDPTEAERRVTSRTKAIVPVHFAGRPANMDAILAIAARHQLKIVEDCAHAIETEYKGRKAGTIGDFGCFSFYVTKNIVTGEGGMVISSAALDHERVKLLSLHGMSHDAWNRFGASGYRHYQVVEAGYKYNMMDLQAVIGIEQLRKVDQFWNRRQEIWLQYQAAFADLSVGRPAPIEEDERHAYHLYTLLIDEEAAGISRDEFLVEMRNKKIGVGVHYLSIPEHPFYQERYGWNPDHYPHAKRIGRQTVSLPLTSKMSDRDVADVIEAVRSVVTK
ncbi:DegT/DnrJ/EryC1/StrS aminotransferase family protein [Bradyrhizobium sp. MOS002]|uniref:DegT/DnrJ/EryC1/StrS family aminotransferase n=1 Tax=Bradyrhizobium sp. MOS002 TaxID=2133947 RepID=UPI000D132001|nr:DegT/DnrJ/EryC1/StrS family aminotransferase [Bradyrhizobium sp. MOS002]PSO25962.1 UDP-4-amino-4,6-dideoxy-N-acetyl-beta-L-altrosamine transaminase [Bradyrhizobium sp. MOS002]